MTHAAKNAHL